MTEQKKATCYELSYLFIPTLDEAGASRVYDSLRALIDEKGSFTTEGVISKIPLAYSMRKNINNEYKYFDQAYFGWVRFTADSSVAKELQSKIEALPEVLRILMIKASDTVVEYTPLESEEYASVENTDTNKEEATDATVSEDVVANEVEE